MNIRADAVKLNTSAQMCSQEVLNCRISSFNHNLLVDWRASYHTILFKNKKSSMIKMFKAKTKRNVLEGAKKHEKYYKYQNMKPRRLKAKLLISTV